MQQQMTPENTPAGAYPPMMFSPDGKADILDKINPGNVVDEVHHLLLGEKKENNQWKKDADIHGICPEGAWKLAALMLPVSSKNVALSWLTDHEINVRSTRIALAAQKLMIRNWHDWKINTSHLIFVHEIVYSNTYLTLKMAKEGGVQRLIGRIVTELRSVVGQEQQKANWFSQFKMGQKFR